MTRETARRAIMGTFILVLALITAEELYVNKRVPLPTRYVAAGILWVLLSVFSEIEPTFGAGIAIIATVGLFLSTAAIGKLPGAADVRIPAGGATGRRVQ